MKINPMQLKRPGEVKAGHLQRRRRLCCLHVQRMESTVTLALDEGLAGLKTGAALHLCLEL